MKRDEYEYWNYQMLALELANIRQQLEIVKEREHKLKIIEDELIAQIKKKEKK